MRLHTLGEHMKISEYLTADHLTMGRTLKQLEGQLETGSHSTAELQGMVSALYSALGNHAKLEDQVLLPALGHALGRDDGPLAVMEAEHSQISALFSRIDGAQDDDNVPKLIKDLTGLLISHFAKEERDLFPQADDLLGTVEIDEFGAMRFA